MKSIPHRYDVFVSYSRIDYDWVKNWLLTRLENANISVCIDERDFTVGIPSLVNIERAVEQSCRILLILTPNWIESEWTSLESLLVQNNDPANLQGRLLPIMLKTCIIPKRISILTYAYFTSPERWDGELQRIIDNLDSEKKNTEFTEVELTIHKDFSLYTDEEQKKLLRAIGYLLEFSDIRVIRKRHGSVKLTITVPSYEVDGLIRAVEAGYFDDFEVVDAEPVLTLTDHPSLEDLKIWWAEMQNDPARPIVCTDMMSSDLNDFLIPIRSGDIRISMFLYDKKVAGVFYFHDTGVDVNGPYAWLGAYILPAYRGKIAAQAWTLTRQACAAEGLYRIFCAIRYSNRPAKRFITGTLGFTRLGNYIDWAPFQGHYDTATLFSMRRQDQGLAWSLAEKLANTFRSRRLEFSETESKQLLNKLSLASIQRHCRTVVASPSLLLTIPTIEK